MTRGAELQAVAREGKRLRTRHLEVRAVASPLPHARVGFIVPKHGQNSVARNRLKRRLRELARTSLLPGAPAVDLVIRTRRDAYALDFATLAADVARAREEMLKRFGGGGAAVGTTDRAPLAPTDDSAPRATGPDTEDAREP